MDYLLHTISFYIFIITMLFVIRPSICFTNNIIKKFGTGQNKTLFPCYLIALGCSIIFLFAANLLNKIEIIVKP